MRFQNNHSKKLKLGKMSSPLLKSRKLLSAINATLLMAVTNGVYAAPVDTSRPFKESNDYEVIPSKVASANVFRLKNRWIKSDGKQNYLNIEYGYVTASNIWMDAASAQWRFRRRQNSRYFDIVNVWKPDCYLGVRGNAGDYSVTCGPYMDNSYWKRDNVDGYDRYSHNWGGGLRYEYRIWASQMYQYFPWRS